jgi:protein arginine N-methyltransferase 1
MYRGIHEHRAYVGDAERVDAFRRAIERVVRPGDVVLDLASGTGILGFIALRAGAARVYAIELKGIVGLARRLAVANGFGDRFVAIRGLSTRVRLPEAVDVIVTDQMGPFGFEAGLFGIMSDAAKRFLKPGGRLIPREISLWAAPVTCDHIRSEVDLWQTRPHGFDYSAAFSVAANSAYAVGIHADALLAVPQRVSTPLVTAEGNVDVGGAVSFEINRAGRLDGIAGWFSVVLADDVTMTNGPCDARRIDRRNGVLPLSPGVEVVPGDRLTVSLSLRPYEIIASWRVQLHSAAGRQDRAFTGSTFKAMMFSSEDARRTHPDARPALSRAGRARQLVLEMIDQRTTVRQIEQAVADSFPELFAGADTPEAFVGEALARNAD